MATRSTAGIFVLVVTLLAAVIALWLAATSSLPGARTFLVGAIFAALMAAATARQIHFGFRANVDLTTLLIVAMVLAFEPQIAALATAAGAVSGHLVQRMPLNGVLFNSA